MTIIPEKMTMRAAVKSLPKSHKMKRKHQNKLICESFLGYLIKFWIFKKKKKIVLKFLASFSRGPLHHFRIISSSITQLFLRKIREKRIEKASSDGVYLQLLQIIYPNSQGSRRRSAGARWPATRVARKFKSSAIRKINFQIFSSL